MTNQTFTMEKAEVKRDSLGEDDARPPSYAEQVPRQEPPPDLSARLAQLNLEDKVGPAESIP
jgi:hypothetical protein